MKLQTATLVLSVFGSALAAPVNNPLDPAGSGSSSTLEATAGVLPNKRDPQGSGMMGGSSPLDAMSDMMSGGSGGADKPSLDSMFDMMSGGSGGSGDSPFGPMADMMMMPGGGDSDGSGDSPFGSMDDGPFGDPKEMNEMMAKMAKAFGMGGLPSSTSASGQTQTPTGSPSPTSTGATSGGDMLGSLLNNR